MELHLSNSPNTPVEFCPLIAADQPDPETLVFVPLVFHDEALGTLSIQNLEPDYFDDEDVQILTLLANQVSLAISDMRLFSYLQGLNEAGQQLTREISSDTLLDTLVDRIRNATNADIVTLYPYVQNSDIPLEEQFGDPRASGQFWSGGVRKAVRSDDIAWLALSKRMSVWAQNCADLWGQLSDGKLARRGNFEIREKIASTAVLPLQVERESVGVLFVNYRHTQDFKAPQKNFISGLANFAAIAIYNNRRFQDLYKHRLTELEAFRQIDLDISASLKLRDVLQAILTRASETVKANAASIYLLSETTGRLEREFSFGIDSDNLQRHAMSVDDRGLLPWAFRNKQSVRVDNVKTDPRWKDIYFKVLEGTTSELDVPLIRDGKEGIGVISFESTKEGAFGEGDEAFLVTLAGQAVLAIKEARLYEEAEEGRRSLESLYEVTKKIIAQKGDPESVIRFILSESRKLIGAEGALLQQFRGLEPGNYYVDSNDQDTENSLIKRDGGYELGIVQRVATTKTPYTTVGIDAQDDPYYKGSSIIHSETAVPLLAQDGSVIGVLDLESPRCFAFDKRDERVLDLFGELAVVAIKNAGDYTRATEEAKRFELLAEAGSELGEIIGPSDLESAYNVIIAKVGDLSKGEVVIRRYDQITEELVAVAVGNERAIKPLQRIKRSEGINGQVAREMRTIRVDNLEQPPPGVAKSIADDSTIKSLIVTPLVFERTYYGNLVLSEERPNCFSDADEILFQGLAKQLAITIHRLEIAKAKHDAERDLQSLRVMSEVGQSAMEIAHRLGNELKPVDVYVESIRMELEKELISHTVINEQLSKVTRDISSLINMAKGLRSQINTLGQVDQEKTIIPVDDLLAEAKPSLHAPDNFEIEWQIHQDIPPVHVVPGQIIDILRNLFNNSVDAMPSGGKIIIRAFHNLSSEEISKEFVMIEVEDNGPGIKEEDKHKVLNLFFSTKGSSGFGLWSSFQYARRNGGNLNLTSTSRLGTKFTLTMPAALKQDRTQ